MNTPKMIPGTVEMVSVEWILKNTDHSVDGVLDAAGNVDYLRMALRKGADHQFPALVATLMEQGFRAPIVLCLNYANLFGETRNVVHGNGHHRMVAALLLFLEEIPVFWSDYSDNHDYMCTQHSEKGRLDWDSHLADGLWEQYYSPWHD